MQGLGRARVLTSQKLGHERATRRFARRSAGARTPRSRPVKNITQCACARSSHPVYARCVRSVIAVAFALVALVTPARADEKALHAYDGQLVITRDAAPSTVD